jgi:raffinose/stachyose/melibiose transport system permease protein
MRESIAERTIRRIILVVLAVFAIGPVAVLLDDGLRPNAAVQARPVSWPTGLTLSNFVSAWNAADLGRGLLNSLLLVVCSVAGVCVVSTLAAYALTVIRGRGSGGMTFYLLAASGLPVQFFLLPLFFLWAKIGLYNEEYGLILIYIAIFSPFSTLLLRSFLGQIPEVIWEAARIDGATERQILYRVFVRIGWPGIVTVALVTGLAVYNEFFFAVTFLESANKFPASLSFFYLNEGITQDYALVAAAGVMVSVPIVALFFILQRRFIAGISVGSVR